MRYTASCAHAGASLSGCPMYPQAPNQSVVCRRGRQDGWLEARSLGVEEGFKSGSLRAQLFPLRIRRAANAMLSQCVADAS